jgi:hypothetical protein
MENTSKRIAGINERWVDKSIKLFQKRGFRFLSLPEFESHIRDRVPFPKKSVTYNYR